MQKRIILTLSTGVCLLVSALALAAAQPAKVSGKHALASLTQQAVSTDTNLAARAIAALRSKGPAGLDALITANLETIQLRQSGADAAGDKPAWSRLCAALDCVSAQHDSYASGLFWHTNFAEAKTAAHAAGKPVLSLRLLGRLDEDCSCANSRFFRTTLYANTAVSQYLRDHFILHWQSVRPVPRITVDFGDGRKIERTITGNSIHYILDSAGTPIDALPGLYSPKIFLEKLRLAESEALTYSANKNDLQLRRYHARLRTDARTALAADLARIGAVPPVQPVSVTLDPPTARQAGPRAAGKFVVERPLLNSFQPMDDATWLKIAALHQGDALLDDSSVKLIRAKAPSAKQAAPIAITKGAPENPLIRLIFNLQRSIAVDTVRNEYSLHATIHQWFAEQPFPQDLDVLNSRVYAQLFLTPDSDPWLGLVPADTFTGLDNNGLVCPSK